ncbi:MAG: FliG C-terminal domain-containing protein [Buchnera aphidicola (Eriosoma harunire)]
MVNIKGIEKSALLLMSLSDEQASTILSYLKPKEIKLLTAVMLKISRAELKYDSSVLEEFKNFSENNKHLHSKNLQDYLFPMLKNVLGEEEAIRLLDEEIIMNSTTKNLNLLNHLDAEELFLLIKNEHIQIITMLVLCIERDLAANIVVLFNQNVQVEIMLRLTRFQFITRKVMMEFLKFVDILIEYHNCLFKKINGIKVTAEILKLVKDSIEKKILHIMTLYNDNVVTKVKNSMFVFKNILDLSDINIKMIINEIDKKKLFFVMQHSDVLIQKKFLNNMSEIDIKNFKKNCYKDKNVSDVVLEEKKTYIVMLIKNLLDNGKMSLTTLE